MSRYPLGRIHPHGSGGKSVYQRLASAVKGRDGWMFKAFLYGIGVMIGISAFADGEVNGVAMGIAFVWIMTVFHGTD